MPHVMTMEPGADVEAVVRANASDYGEDGWEIVGQEEQDGTLFVKVLWDSERPTLAYVRHRDGMTERDADILREAIETASFRIVETEGGHWSIHRDTAFREHVRGG